MTGRPAHTHGEPSAAPSGASAQRGWGKQFVKFSFYRVADEVRRGSDEERLRIGKRLASLMERSAERMLTRTYATVGTRADTDLLIWQVADDLSEIEDWHADFLSSLLAAALERPYSYL